MSGERLTVGELRALLANMPDDAPVEIFNPGYEWYGVDDVIQDQVRVINGRAVIHFGGAWSAQDPLHPGDASREVQAYLKDKGREVRP